MSDSGTPGSPWPTRRELSPTQRRLRRRLAIAVSVLVLAAPWLVLVPMGVWRGLAVIEPCDLKAQDRFGVADPAHAVRGEEHVRLWPPSWVCPLSNGESVSVSLLG